jgi:uncharacterized membrane protein (UPF0127 family)
MRLDDLPAQQLDNGAIVFEAATLRSRLLGLAFMRSMPNGCALLIPHCRSVHTFGMRFAIDVAFLDERGRPLRVERAVPRRRVRSCRGAFAVLETSAGEIDQFVTGRCRR